MTSRALQSGRIVGLLSATAVALMGTINLWKVSTIQSRIPIDLTLAATVLAACLTLGTWGLHGLRVERRWVPLVVGFAAFTPALFATTGENAYSVQKSQGLFTLCLLSAAAPMLLLTNQQRRRSFLKVLACLGLAFATWLLLGGSADPSGRMQIDAANPIALSRVACLAFVILGIAALRSKGTRRLLALAGVTLSAVAAVSTGSRGPFASAVVAVVLVTLLTKREGGRAGTIVSLVVLALAAWQSVAQFAPTSALDRIAAAQGAGDFDRIRLLAESGQIFLEHPLGVGWGNIGDYLSVSARIPDQGLQQYPHNVFAEVAAEGGILALAGLMILLVASWRRLRTAATTPQGQALLALWILAVGSAMTSSDVLGDRLMWMMIGVGLALPVLDLKTRRRNSHPQPATITAEKCQSASTGFPDDSFNVRLTATHDVGQAQP
jgi:O-antigen ligase